jgi:hypothetical protein
MLQYVGPALRGMSLLHLAGLPALAFIYTPGGYVHYGRLYQTCQGGSLALRRYARTS